MFALLERTIRRLQSRANAQVVLLDLPRHPRTQAIFGNAELEYQTQLSDAAVRLNVPIWSLTEDAGIEPADFHDFAHVGNVDARRRIQSLLCHRISQLISESKDL